MQKLLIVTAALIFAVACQTKSNKHSSSVNNDTVAHPDRGHHNHSRVTAGTQADLEENVGNKIFFTFDSSSLNSESHDILTRQAAWMKANPEVRITLEGHCDKRGTREYNLGLGERRANAAKNFLANAGIDSNRISVISYGKERPLILGDTEEANAQNRRSVTVVSN